MEPDEETAAQNSLERSLEVDLRIYQIAHIAVSEVVAQWVFSFLNGWWAHGQGMTLDEAFTKYCVVGISRMSRALLAGFTARERWIAGGAVDSAVGSGAVVLDVDECLNVERGAE